MTEEEKMDHPGASPEVREDAHAVTSEGSGVDWSAAPEGWNPLDLPAEDGVPVEGLLSNGRVTEAQWWGPVPEGLQTPGWDGSGWAWDNGGLDEFFDDSTLIAWRPYAVANRPPPPGPEDQPK